MQAERTYGEVLLRRAESAPDKVAFSFVEEDGSRTTLTYAELHARACEIARAIEAERPERTSPVLLIFPPGLEFVAALFGCFYAGAPAVPAFPPIPTRLQRTLPRMLAILEDSTAGVALTIGPLRPAMEEWIASAPGLASARVVATDELPHGPTERDLGDVRPDGLALIQYTSGSTSSPKGVMLTHEHLLSSAERIHGAMGLTDRDPAMTWLPPYHDLGLIGGIMQPVYWGTSSVLMSPMTFLRHPIRWLSEMSRTQAALSGAPNFAYDLCVRRTTPEEREGLDLSSWRIALSGAEPVNADSIRDFSEAFAPYGFRPEAFYPAYGLAEVVLQVSGGAALAGPRVLRVRRDRLDRDGVVEVATDDAPARVLVGCGPPLAGDRLVVVDPETRRTLPEGEVGEIWFSSRSVGAGYWRRPQETQATFQAETADTGEGPFLRTGDFGFVLDGEVFVTGRMKEVIIINGRNYHPLDIEKACEASVARLRPNCGAAFSVSADSERESLVIVYEVSGDGEDGYAPVVEQIRRTVASETSVQPEAIVLIEPRSLPKTSSGKIQRFLCRQRFLDGELNVLAEWHRSEAGPARASSASPPRAAPA